MTKDKPTVLLEHYLKRLKLPTFLREHEKMAIICRQEEADYRTYLLRLAELEAIDRERRAAERRIRAAKFPIIKTIDTFDFDAQPSINRELVRELMRCEYVTERENVLLAGNSGTGKTHLATALAFAACSQGKRVRFFSTTGLVTELPRLWDRVECPEERTGADVVPAHVARRHVCPRRRGSTGERGPHHCDVAHDHGRRARPEGIGDGVDGSRETLP